MLVTIGTDHERGFIRGCSGPTQLANRADSMSGAILKVGVVADSLPELALQLVISSSHRGGACSTNTA